MAWKEQHLCFRAYWEMCCLLMYANCNMFETCLYYCFTRVLFGLRNMQQKLMKLVFQCVWGSPSRRIRDLISSNEQLNKDGDFTIHVSTLMSRWLWCACWLFKYQLYLMKHIDFVMLIYVWGSWEKFQKRAFSDSAEVLDKAVELLGHFSITSLETLNKFQVYNTPRADFLLFLWATSMGKRIKAHKRRNMMTKKYALFKLLYLRLKLPPWRKNHSLVRKVAIGYRLQFFQSLKSCHELKLCSWLVISCVLRKWNLCLLFKYQKVLL